MSENSQTAVDVPADAVTEYLLRTLIEDDAQLEAAAEHLAACEAEWSRHIEHRQRLKAALRALGYSGPEVDEPADSARVEAMKRGRRR